VLIAAALPLVVMIGLGSAWASFACRIDRTTRTHCCCPKAKAEDRSEPRMPTVRAAGCCDVSVHRSAPMPSYRDKAPLVRAGTDAPASATVALLVEPARIAATPFDVGWSETARPPPRVASFLDKSAILR
jgi:hypothetical protein